MSASYKTIDGNEAAAYISYAFTDVAAIYPITPSSPMAELVDQWSSAGKKNLFGQPVKVVEMQSEAGAAGAVHGSLQAGALTTTYTASQGLLLMLPNMYKMAGELLPAVFHVSARALAAHALSIFGDQQDVMLTRPSGFALLASTNAQEVMDLGAVAHLAAIKARMPILHFFDGFRTSHELQKVQTIDYQDVGQLIDHKALEEFRSRALSPNCPVIRGTAQNPDIYFQGREVANPYFDRIPEIVNEYMKQVAAITGRQYQLFDYYGSPEAERVIVAMGSVNDTISETVDYLNERGERVGLVKVRLYRPFSATHFLQSLPRTVKRIAVLDRTKEPGALGEPLHLDVVKAFAEADTRPLIVGGRYGLGSKDTRPSHIKAVFDNLQQQQPKDRFTIGIHDDVTNLSLPEGEAIDTTPAGTISCKLWGLGSDGTVGANKSAIKIIGEHTDLYAQAYFYYDSKKSGGTTISYLRFGKQPIRSPYLVYSADYIACHNPSFVYNYDLLKGLKPGGIFVLNCPWNDEQLEQHLPAKMKQYIAKNDIKFYTIDALSLADEIGLGGRINMIMQSAFFQLTKVIPVEDAVRYLKESVEKVYGHKGQKIVEMNHQAIEEGTKALKQISVPASWKSAQEEREADLDVPEYVRKIQEPMSQHEGDELPTSAFLGREDGTFPPGSTAYEKRGIAVRVPQWQIEKCIQCNQCSFICPHAVIRPFLLDEDEKNRAPERFETLEPKGQGFSGLHYRIQVSPLDCTGCGNCADICPAPGKALVMEPAEQEIDAQKENWEFAMTVTEKPDRMDRYSLKGSQFVRPLFEFHGACPGCGETPYLRLLSQLFGDRMMIANATGCSSIYSASAPSTPYTTNDQGQGPSWANSLFEDNAEFGYGMYLGVKQQREKLVELVEEAVKHNISDELGEAFRQWLDRIDDGVVSRELTDRVTELLSEEKESSSLLKAIWDRRDLLVKRSQWIIGGDGWAYDIGFGGVDQVLSTGDDVNLLVMDTEVYSNTGGQSSKATPTAAIAKFAAGGKQIRKKDLGMMAVTYGYVYVAQIAMGANMNHTIRTLVEAERYPGPSLVIAYSPCISHGIKSGMGTSILQEKRAVKAGYWHLWRFNPQLKKEGKNPFILDSKEPSEPFQEFLESEIRFSSLKNLFPEQAEILFSQAEEHAKERYETYKRFAQMY